MVWHNKNWMHQISTNEQIEKVKYFWFSNPQTMEYKHLLGHCIVYIFTMSDTYKGWGALY